MNVPEFLKSVRETLESPALTDNQRVGHILSLVDKYRDDAEPDGDQYDEMLQDAELDHYGNEDEPEVIVENSHYEEMNYREQEAERLQMEFESANQPPINEDDGNARLDYENGNDERDSEIMDGGIDGREDNPAVDDAEAHEPDDEFYGD